MEQFLTKQLGTEMFSQKTIVNVNCQQLIELIYTITQDYNRTLIEGTEIDRNIYVRSFLRDWPS